MNTYKDTLGSWVPARYFAPIASLVQKAICASLSAGAGRGFTGRFGHVLGTFLAIFEFSAAPTLVTEASISRRINDLGVVALPA